MPEHEKPNARGLFGGVFARGGVEADDTAWLQAMLDAEAGLARALERAGLAPAGAGEAVTAAARAGNFDPNELGGLAALTGNPVPGLARALARQVPQTAVSAVHRGATSQDIVDTAAMLLAKRAIDVIAADLARAADAAAGLATAHRDSIMIGRTLLQQAVPVTFGLVAAGWLTSLDEARAGLDSVGPRLAVQFGGAAGTLAGYLQYAGDGAEAATVLAELVDAFADETGLAAPVLPWHALRTPVTDLGAALAHTTGALGKIAVDVLVLARTEIGELAEPAVAGRGASSAMPHKRNPVLSTLIRSAALQVPALAAVLAQCLPHEDERSAGVWHAEWQPLREALRLTGGAAHTAVELVRGLTVDPERMAGNLAATGGQLVSERVSAVLAPKLGRAAAKELLTRASLRAAETARPLAEVLAESDALRGVLTPAELTALLDPAGYTGAAGPLVDRALAGSAPVPRKTVGRTTRVV